MKSWLVVSCVVGLLFATGIALAQYDYPPHPGPQYGPPQSVVNAPQSQTVVNQPNHQTVVEQRPMVPVPGTSPPPSGLVPPTQEGWKDGWRESWVHEFRPLKDYGHYRSYGSHDGHYDHRYPASEGWYYNPRTGNYQRNVTPSYSYPTQGYCQPQGYSYPSYGYYSYPNYGHCQPQYYRSRCSVWPW